MEYVIKSIKHSGRKGERLTERTDGRYPLRIGRIVDICKDTIVAGKSMVINYLKDSDGSDYSHMCLWTSPVKKINDENNRFVVETMNSIFEFEKC